MREYFLSVYALAALLAVIAFLIPGGAEGDAVRRGISALALCAVLTPVCIAVRGVAEADIAELLPAEMPEETLYSERLEEAFCLGIREAVAGRFSIDPENITVSVTGYDPGGVHADKICVILRARAALADTRGIRAYVSGLGCGECEVEIEI